MQDRKTGRPDDTVVDSDATSKETLKDLEHDQKDSGSGSNDSADESEVPAPDGAEAERRKREDDGPM